MTLVLKRNPEVADDYLVLHGDLQVGQVYKRKAAIMPGNQWLWALNGVPETPGGLGVAGVSPTLDEAKAALQERWSRWLTGARLAELEDRADADEGADAEDGAEDDSAGEPTGES